MIPTDSVEIISATLFDLGAVGTQEEWLEGEAPPLRQPWDDGSPPPIPRQVRLKAWWSSDGWDIREDGVRAVLAPHQPEVSMIAESDWAAAWQAGFRRIPVGPSLAVAPPWDAQPGDVIIEPGMAFGTGEHPTTRACLDAVVRLARTGARCLDVGTGSGVLALAAAHLGMNVLGIDNDPVAVRAARENAERNGLSARFELSPLIDIEGRFQLIVANLFAEVIVQMGTDLERLCGGTLVVAGILLDREDIVRNALSGLRLASREVDGGWVCLEWTS